MSRLSVDAVEDGFDLCVNGTLVVRHRRSAPAFFLGSGRAKVAMSRGNFDLDARLDERLALRVARVSEASVGLSIAAALPDLLTLRIEGNQLHLACADPALNRFWMRTVAEPGERLWGGGEQMSYFNLAGRRFPLWTSEPGVGRDKSTLVTFEADRLGNAGGDYWNTNYPQPTYLSSRRYALHVETTAYACFDFRDPGFHEIEAWEVPARVELFCAERFAGLVTELSTRFGRPPRLPEWAYSGAILGLKDGLNSFARMEAIVAAGAIVTGLWCEDWAGLRVTSFGKRLFWDWKANKGRYPGLRAKIAELADRGIRFLAYVNPYLAVDGALYGEAVAAGFLARRMDSDEPYRVDFGEFEAGVLDFTLPAAAAWFAERVIGQEMLDLGVAGWMADFGRRCGRRCMRWPLRGAAAPATWSSLCGPGSQARAAFARCCGRGISRWTFRGMTGSARWLGRRSRRGCWAMRTTTAIWAGIRVCSATCGRRS